MRVLSNLSDQLLKRAVKELLVWKNTNNLPKDAFFRLLASQICIEMKHNLDLRLAESFVHDEVLKRFVNLV